jgi:predicted nucleic acid-binding protein
VTYLLDSNVLSDGIKPKPHRVLDEWMLARRRSELFVSVVSVGEIRRGILELPAGRKRQLLEQWYEGPAGPGSYGKQAIAFDQRAAEAWAELIAAGKRAGRPRSAIDMMIAATALVHNLVVVSLNEGHFEGIVPYRNPLRD